MYFQSCKSRWANESDKKIKNIFIFSAVFHSFWFLSLVFSQFPLCSWSFSISQFFFSDSTSSFYQFHVLVCHLAVWCMKRVLCQIERRADSYFMSPNIRWNSYRLERWTVWRNETNGNQTNCVVFLIRLRFLLSFRKMNFYMFGLHVTPAKQIQIAREKKKANEIVWNWNRQWQPQQQKQWQFSRTPKRYTTNGKLLLHWLCLWQFKRINIWHVQRDTWAHQCWHVSCTTTMTTATQFLVPFINGFEIILDSLVNIYAFIFSLYFVLLFVRLWKTVDLQYFYIERKGFLFIFSVDR